ncbi:MAG: InlB B-repeat-containing protein, partial [Clostridiales bacterium]|nr:InlB B-repeat-containing protein [Clostridiales bacterium]
MTNQWKRLLSGMLALALAFSLFVPAMATSVEDETADDQTAVTDVVDDTSQDTEAAETETDEAEAPADAESEEEAADTETDEESADSPAQENEEAVPEETASDETSEPETDAVAEKVAAVVEADTAAQTVIAVADAEAEPVAVAEPEAAAEEIAEAEPVAEEDEEENDDTTSYAAEYNGTQYETLQAAFDAVSDAYKECAPTGEMEESSVITLLTDVTENINFSLVPTSEGWSNVNLTLDLNGHTLSGTGDTSSTKGVFYLSRSTSYGGTYLYFTVKDGTIANGYSSSYAGAIYGYGSYVYVTCENVSFINNTGKSAGAVYSKSVTLNNCTFTGNTATSYAGAVYSPAGCILSMSNCTITGNSGVRGGGVYIGRAASSNTTFTIDSSNKIYGNTASTAGDDLYLTATSGSKTLTVDLSGITSWGGVMYQDGTYDDSTIGEGTRYSQGNTTVITDSVQLCYVASSSLMRSIGIKVVPVTYTVTFTDGVEDKEVFTDQVYTVISGNDTPAFDGTPTRDGYVFKGWTPEVAETVTEDVTYTATWAALYTVTYTDGVDGEVVFEDQTYTVEDGNDTPAFEGTPERTGYTFTGWEPTVTDTVTGSVTYVAQWTANTYTVTLDADGGTVDPSTLTVTYDSAIGELPTPERDGYRFDGWFDANGNEYTAETVYKLTSDLTLTAQWTIYVARYETTGELFVTLQAAFDAVGEAWKADAPTASFEASSTITMLADVTENISLSIVPTGGTWSDLNLILDMNGHTLSGTGDTTSSKGAIWLYRATSYNGAYFYFTAKNGTITNGYTTTGAGGVYLTGSHGYLTFENVNFTNNTGSSAGAVTGGVEIKATNCTFTGNTGTSGAGAIYSAAGSTLTLTNCTITGNHAGQSGGGIRVNRAASSNTTLDLASGNNIIYGNTADVAGDDIFVTASSGQKTLTVNLADGSVYAGKEANLYEDGTYDDSTIGENTRYSEGNLTEITGSLSLTYIATSANMRSVGIKVVPVTYTVTYTDGVEDEVVFADQVYTVESGEATPAFEGTPTRTNYNFIGWEPEVSTTVTGNITYVAQWEPSTNNKPADSKKPKASTINSMQIRAYFIGTDSFSTSGELLSLSPSSYKAGTVSSYEIGEIYGNDVTGYFIDITFHFAHGDKYETGASTTFNTSTSFNKTYAKYMPDWIGNWEYDFDYAEGYGADQVLTLKWSGSAWKSLSTSTGEYTGNLTTNINNLIKAYLTLPRYTVTYTDGVDGVELFADQVTTVASGAATPAYEGETPTRTGYTFAGWDPEVADTVSADTTYTAVWTAKTYTVTLNGNGATLDTETVEVTYGSAYPELPTPTTLKGFTGEGWYIVNEDGTYTKITDETVVSIAGDHDLIYLWSVADFSVTLTSGYKNNTWSLGWSTSLQPFDLIATVTEIDGLTYSYQWYKDGEAIDGATDSTLTINGNVLESGKYTVVVTATLADGSTIVLVDDSATAEASNTLTIRRMANTLYYEANGGTGGPSNNFANKNTLTIQSTKPTREGYTFVSWNTEADGSGDTYYGGGTYDFSDYYTDENTLANGGLKATLYAQWSARSYTLTLDAGNGAFSDGNSTTTIPVTYNSAIGELLTPTREGYTFGGWVDAEGNPVTEETIYTTAGNSTLTATWTANEYTITVNPGNGDEPYEVTVTYEDVVADKIDDPEREGYTFEGWVDEDGNPVNLNVPYTENFPDTLTADWTADVYTITVDPGNGDEPYEVTVTYEDVVADKIDDPEREGYTFVGWVDENGDFVDL